jgi:hypothetical protein
MECAVKFPNDTFRLQIFEEIESTDEFGRKLNSELLGSFAFASIPRQGDVITLRALGEVNWDGFSENLYVVVEVMHHGCHLAWDTLNDKRRELKNGPSVSLVVRFQTNRQQSEQGGWYASSRKGRLRSNELGAQRYSVDDEE